MKTLAAISLSFALVACAYPITEVDTSGAEPACVRQCTATYSTCIQGGPAIGAKTETLRACRDAYAVCVSTCKQK